MSQSAPESTDLRGQMPFREHLVELRQRMLKASLGVGVAFFVAWAFHLELYTWISAPVRSAMADNGLFAIRAMQITESISVYIKIALLGAIVLSSPWIFLQIWAFVAPGLLDREKRMVVPVVAASVLFFTVGIGFCYAVVLPFMTDFLIKMTVEGPDVSLVPTLQNVVSYSLWLLLAFGVVFELPVFMYFLSALGLVTAAGLVAFYRYWIVISFVIGAVLTPTPDPVNQALMGGPLVLLYGVGVIIAWVVEQDRDAGSRWSWRGAGALALLLVGAVLLGGAKIANMAQRSLAEDVPLTARQVVGVRSGSLARVMQQAGADGKKALGVLSVLHQHGGFPRDKAMLWLVRTEDGAAAAMRRNHALQVVRKVSRASIATEADYAGGKSVLLKLKDSPLRWRIAAPDDRTLWVGEDRAVGALAAARLGRVPSLAGDPRLMETVELLRAQGPIFALSTTTDGIGGWLPAGALADTVKLATAVIPPEAKAIRWVFGCRGPEAASALRNRLDAWAADTRSKLAPSPKKEDEATDGELRQQVVELAKLVSKATTAVLRSQPADDRTLQMLRDVASEADRIGQRLASPDKPAPVALADTALHRAIAAKAVLTAKTDGPILRWQVEVAAEHAIDALFAPSNAGIKRPLPARKRKAKDKTDDDDEDDGAESSAAAVSDKEPENPGK